MSIGKVVGVQIALLWLLLSAFGHDTRAETVETIGGTGTYSPEADEIGGGFKRLKITFKPGVCINTIADFKKLEKTFDGVFQEAPGVTIKSVTVQASGRVYIYKRAKKPQVWFALNAAGADSKRTKRLYWNRPAKHKWSQTVTLRKGDLREVHAKAAMMVDVGTEDPEICLDRLSISWNWKLPDEELPAPTDKPEPTATPAPTVDPAPSATPAPSDTPVPSSTPEPSAAPTPRWYALDFSLVSSRKGARALNNAYFGNEDCIFVFISPIWDGHVQLVQFYLDGSPRKTEQSAPFDLEGTAPSGQANQFDLKAIAIGWHEVKAVMQTTEGERVLTARFYKATDCESCR